MKAKALVLLYEFHFSGLTLNAGENWLFIEATSFGGPAGVAFSGVATISTVTSDVPGPVSMGFPSIGAAVLLICRKREGFSGPGNRCAGSR